MRRLHGDRRRQGGAVLRHAGAAARGQAGHHAGGAGDRRGAGGDPRRRHGRAGGAMRLLHSRNDDAGAGAIGAQQPPDGCGNPRRAAAEPVPLRHPYAHPAGGASRRRLAAHRRCIDQPEERAMNAPMILDRRRVLAGGGALIVSFSLRGAFAQDQAAPAPAPLPGSLKQSPFLDSWIRVDADGGITLFSGKAEIGQGVKTALQQVAAEELDVPFASLKLVTAETARTANEGYTSGSNSMKDSGTAIQNAAAQVRALLVAEAARRFDVPAENLRTENGAVIAPDGRRLRYGELVAAEMLHVQAQPKSQLKDPATFKVVGQPVPRVDIPAKVTGGAAYVQDLRLPGMVHARVVRPPGYGARLTECDTAAVEKLPGVVKIVRDGNFLAVVAEKEFQSVKAMHALSVAAKWQEKASLPKQDDLLAVLTSLPAHDTTI